MDSSLSSSLFSSFSLFIANSRISHAFASCLYVSFSIPILLTLLFLYFSFFFPSLYLSVAAYHSLPLHPPPSVLPPTLALSCLLHCLSLHCLSIFLHQQSNLSFFTLFHTNSHTPLTNMLYV